VCVNWIILFSDRVIYVFNVLDVLETLMRLLLPLRELKRSWGGFESIILSNLLWNLRGSFTSRTLKDTLKINKDWRVRRGMLCQKKFIFFSDSHLIFLLDEKQESETISLSLSFSFSPSYNFDTNRKVIVIVIVVIIDSSSTKRQLHKNQVCWVFHYQTY
jgi:hypothetical protein